MKIIAALFTILCFQFCNAQNLKPQREAFTLKLPVDGVSFYEEEIKSGPYFVHGNILQIYPSEKFFIEVELKNDSIISMKTVKENLDPKNTIEIEFSQTVKNKKSEMMILKVKNPFTKKLEYEAKMYVVGHNKWISTSIMPVQPNIVGYETWNDVIISLALDNWKLTK
ncbi:MAG: hypothetical protein ABI685_03165 [Ferruginibacter sp.]